MAELIKARKTPATGASELPMGWAAARARLEGLPDGGLNIAHEAVDRHVAAGHGAQSALIWLGRAGERRVVTYAELAADAARFAHVLHDHGIAPGERMFLLSGRVPELYAATPGAFKDAVVVCPLFAAFGPEPVRARMQIGAASVLVTTEAQYRRKIAGWRADMPGLKLVLILGDTAPDDCVALGPAMAAAPATLATHPTRPEDMALLHFTSGTTGLPKGVVHVHDAVVAHAESGRLALDLRAGDIYWCTGDLAMRDSDGYFWFIGRADDLIKSSGHLIGPFEVESALMEHPAVAEVAVIGIPDATAGEVVKAFVTLKAGFEASEALERDLRGHARKRLGSAMAPREIVFRDSLPRTRSGKIMRRLLRARELGLPEGDLSTLEEDAR